MPSLSAELPFASLAPVYIFEPPVILSVYPSTVSVYDVFSDPSLCDAEPFAPSWKVISFVVEGAT